MPATLSLEDWDILVESFSHHKIANSKHEPRICYHCKWNGLTTENLMTLCTSCGTVQDICKLDNSAEWRYFGEGRDPNRCGCPSSDLMPESSVSTFVGMGHGKTYTTMSRIGKFQQWNSVPYKERALYGATEYITCVAVNNGIPDSIIGDAKVLLKKVTENGVVRGENRKGLLACSVYVACIMNNVPRSIKEISGQFNVSQVSMSKMCKRFSTFTGNIKSTRASDYVRRYCCELHMDDKQSDECLALAEAVQDLIVGATPVSCVAGCIHHIVKKTGRDVDVPRCKIASVCGVSEATIMKCYKKLVEIVDAPSWCVT